jgi:hypothetical protein
MCPLFARESGRSCRNHFLMDSAQSLPALLKLPHEIQYSVMKMNKLHPPAIAVFLLVLPSVRMRPASPKDSFDVPLKKTVVNFSPSPYHVRNKLSCYLYSTFMVKEFDSGEKGAEWLAIVPTHSSAIPECSQTPATGERLVMDVRAGYFLGAKGDLVFFRDADGTNRGMPFVIYDSKSGTKLFEDSYYDAVMMGNKADSSPFSRMRVKEGPDGQVSLLYSRVVEANCDLHLEKAACWRQVRQKLELKSTQAPVCTDYKTVTTRWESAVAYPVEVSLFPQPTTNTIDGPVKCWPVD